MRTPEEGHTKHCFARALICAVENLRDDREVTDTDLRLYVQDTSLRDLAIDYYDGLLACICPPLS